MARQLPAPLTGNRVFHQLSPALDLWATFQQGDRRFVPVWLAEIRRLAR
jgi:hypothetical protein